MSRVRVLALILAGGAGSRMALLTDVRAKPVLPYGGIYRLIDIPLSNCVHSQISDVWVAQQFKLHSLNDHLSNGRPWDLDRTFGGLRLIPPSTGSREGGWHEGNADAIYRTRELIRDFNPDLLIVLSADHVYKLDYRDVIDAHMEQRADVTMVITRVKRDEATRFGNVVIDRQQRVTDFAYKPDDPISDLVTCEIFVYSTDVLLDTLERLADAPHHEGESTGLSDFGDRLLPEMVQRGHAYAYLHDAYWRDVGTIDAYYDAHMDLLRDDPLHLDDAAWPLRTYAPQRMPARIEATARIANSLISPGCRVHGSVSDSVLGPGVVIEEGAQVTGAIIFEDSVVGAGATIHTAIVDARVTIGRDAHVGYKQPHPKRSITLVGQRATIGDGAEVAPGEQIDPGATVR